MNAPFRSHAASIDLDAAPEEVYDLVSDVTRSGEWSVQCRACEWVDAARAGEVGAEFTGHNATPEREWTTTSTVVRADRPHEFAWEVAGGVTRWTFSTAAAGEGTTLTHTWEFLEVGREVFGQRFGDDAEAQIEDRTRAAHAGIPQTLARIAQVLTSSR
ncbi:SRPBCC family protein [Nocardioides acrostichi]|uniref:SRPBCC family protein n=1 Tax=Nocardioides acrostichi TaxID=2784339 RepID=A0A930Y794_9ACTN|nr:SRPBCC family protein [Nocardioides acrostichi]MBF4163175.1 SRPBCC family protein [Nocardioides acrostichi]